MQMFLMVFHCISYHIYQFTCVKFSVLCFVIYWIMFYNISHDVHNPISLKYFVFLF